MLLTAAYCATRAEYCTRRLPRGLEGHSPEITESQPELLAQHYAEAGLVEKAVSYWGKAGHRSAARSAMAEAAAQFQKGLDQLLLMPENPNRQRQELEFRCGLAAALQAVKGAGAPETGHAYRRARELWERLGSPSEFPHVPWGQSRFHTYRGEFDLALRLAEDVLDLSSQRNDSGGLVLGHHSAGHNLLLAGEFAACRLHFEKVLAQYDPVYHASLAPLGGAAGGINAIGDDHRYRVAEGRSRLASARSWFEQFHDRLCSNNATRLSTIEWLWAAKRA